MKRLICMTAAVVCALSVSAAYAKSGDIAGEYYSTDITTTLNGCEIDAINIGGRTLISAENMKYYSFGVRWSGEERKLFINKSAHAVNGAPPAAEKPNLPSGTPIGNYYDTDIVTYLDGEPITAYNIGGRTYILAEQMRDFGYIVDWNEEARLLAVTSPDRAGYEYSIFLSNGEKPEGSKYSDGEGAFSILYTKNGITGRGDAKLFNSSLVCDGKMYSIPMGFYQNAGLFYSNNIKKLLRGLAYCGNIENPCEPEEKYDLVNENIIVKINGQRAYKVAVEQTQGNGHVDFILQILDLPMYKEDEIDEVEIIVGNAAPLAEFPIVKPHNEWDVYKEIIESLKKYPDDFMETYSVSDDYIVVAMMESPSLGIITERLYAVNLKTREVSEDILGQVRQIDGFNENDINVFATHFGDVKNNFFFSCAAGDRTSDFYVELDSGKVHMTAKSE